MPLFVIFVFGAVILGAGAMLAPAWPTLQPRIGLSATFALAIITGGTIFYASLFGWDTLVIDYLLFALVVGIFLGGTLSVGQMRAEKRGETLPDVLQGWPGPQDLAFFAVVALALVLPVLILGVPLGTTAQDSGYLALTTREGGSFITLAPFHPEVEYLYPPGFSALIAYLSRQLNQGIHTVQFAVSGVLALVGVWLAYDLGAELRNKRLGRAMALTMLFSLGTVSAHVSGHTPALMGVLFVMAFILYAVRYVRYNYPVDAIGAGLMLGAAAITHPGMLIVAALGYVPWLATIWLGTPQPSRMTWAVLALGIPLLALAGIAPWVVDVSDLLGAGLRSPYSRSIDHIQVMVTYHGVWIVPMALWGAWIGWQQRDRAVILAAGWLLLILDFAVTGGIAALVPFITRYTYPLDIARHGPIIPYTILGGFGLLWFWDMVVLPKWGALSYRQAYGVVGVIGLILLGVLALNGPLLTASKQLLNAPGAYASRADIAAMNWLKENTLPEDTRILNFPVKEEGGWVPVIAERDSVYFPSLPFARTAPDLTEQDILQAFWENPANPDHAALLRAAEIDYVIVPQIIVNRDSFDEAWRWREPAGWSFSMRSEVASAPYLELVFEQDGAQVYRVLADDEE